jgi:DNA-binding HxlR family transcriptional regulator
MSTPFPPLAALPGRPCPIAASLEVVGERWALLVVRELALGRTRFTDIVRGTGAPRDRIAARLKVLEDGGVVERHAYQERPTRFEYMLSESGRALVPVLDALLAWGLAHAVAGDDPDRMAHYPTPSQRMERSQG